MGRVKIQFPTGKPLYTASIKVRIGDINYGGHVGNDSVLSIIHEARMEMLAENGYTEMKAGGNAMIMADVMIAYKSEAFYGEVLTVTIYVEDITEVAFSLLYRISASRNGQMADVAHAKTGMVCFDYEVRKVTAIKEALLGFLNR
jgi:acyl-CoA thioester hydrolase